jgi:DNA-binding transcriptional ArsR family regulator
MRSDAPPLLPVLRSAAQGRILAATLLHPEREVTLTALAGQVGVPLSTVHAEVRRLLDAGILDERLVGRSRLLRAGTASPLVRPLTDLIAHTFGPAEVVRDEFGDLPGVRRVVIFGSWGRRYLGEPGPPPADVDVLVVGKVIRHEVYAAAERAEHRVGLPVNPVVRSVNAYLEGADGLVREIKNSPSLTVAGGDE